jgi:Ca2+-binding EF-hand superfamily protein
MNDTDDISKIFQIVDSDGSGYLNKEKLQLVCPHLSSSEIDIIFNDLDTNHDNRICLKEFTQGFKELIQPLDDNQHLLKTKKFIKQDSTIDKDDDDLTTNMNQIQINQVLNNLSW